MSEGTTMRTKCFVFFCYLATVAPSAAFAQSADEVFAACPGPSTPEEAQRCRLALKAAAAAKQEAAGETARDAAQAEEDGKLAPLRARIGPGFATSCPEDVWVQEKPADMAPYPRRPALRDVLVAAGQPRDTAEEVAADRAALSVFRTNFEALRCYAMHRRVSAYEACGFDRVRSQEDWCARSRRSGESPQSYAQTVAAAIALELQAKAWVAQRERDLATDETCIATKGCVEARVIRRAAEHLCDLLADRANVQASISREHAVGRQSGSIDLTELHRLGEALQSDDERITDEKTRYGTLAKKPFAKSLCR
jgi:hypothetical protein